MAEDIPERAKPGIRRIQWVARTLDEQFRIPVLRIRIGIDPLVGLLPVGGDVATTIASLYIVFEAFRLGVSRWTLLRMLVNLGIDLAIGSVPVAGDVFDAVWKANVRNVDLVVQDIVEQE